MAVAVAVAVAVVVGEAAGVAVTGVVGSPPLGLAGRSSSAVCVCAMASIWSRVVPPYRPCPVRLSIRLSTRHTTTI